MAELVVQYPDEFMADSGKSREAVEHDLRFQFAAHMFQIGEFSLGQAAKSAGLGKLVFADQLGKAGISLINLDDRETETELNAIRADNNS